MKRIFLLGLMALAISGRLKAQDTTPPTFNIPPPPPQPTRPLPQINLLNLGDPNNVSHVGGDVIPPVVIKRVEPQYSEEARRACYEGTVVLEAIVRRDGTVDIQRLVRSLGFGLDENAIQALKQWRFRPGTRGGTPVDVSLNIEVNFNLRDKCAPAKPPAAPSPLPPDTKKIHWLPPRATVLTEQWVETQAPGLVAVPWGTGTIPVPINAKGVWIYRLEWGNYLLDVQEPKGQKLNVTIHDTVPLGNKEGKTTVIQDDSRRDVEIRYLRKELRKPESK